MCWMQRRNCWMAASSYVMYLKRLQSCLSIHDVKSIMAHLVVPNSATLHLIRRFLDQRELFVDAPGPVVLEFHPQWAHMEPVALAAIAAWGAWWRSQGKTIEVRNLSNHTRYAARMHLFEHLGVNYNPEQVEHEEAGRFLPIRQISAREGVGPVIGDISALLHLDDDPESLAAVQYCVSELLRNVLEHSGSPNGAFVCAHRYTTGAPHRVSIAVADCGQGIATHLGGVHPEALASDSVALGLAMRPGVTGARPGPYGTADNAGAGLFITRCIAKGTGGYFALASGHAGFRQRRSKKANDEIRLFVDPYDDPRHDKFEFAEGWHGTVVGLEIRTEKIADYDGFFQWIFKQIPSRRKRGKIKFS